MNHFENRISVAVRHSDPLVAIGVTAVLGQQLDVTLVDLDRDGEPNRREMPPLIVVADYDNGVRLARQTRHPRPAGGVTKVLVVTACDREHEVRSALEAGVQGYLQLGCDVQELVGGIRLLARGAKCLSAVAGQRIAEGLQYSGLTPREKEVLCRVARGVSNKVVARELGISVGTVKAHVKAILTKLGATTRTQATRIAAGRGLVDLEDFDVEAGHPALPVTTIHTPSQGASHDVRFGELVVG